LDVSLEKEPKKMEKIEKYPFSGEWKPEWNPLGQSKNSPAKLIAQVACCPFGNSTSIPATVQRKA
jgi:hypothetical protein